eukprot:CAMPEP_0184862120 /NCGR_PEP_ID=MMETSP0580-20130426/6638_1 /TAXON_ID=1118495 /ORGANISM="Dactyliosolen fragilissimus" /LENGTH=393 /DNA_ID=CAMNT_0027359853 /DNA_START=217 /DNA_END=1395 /DNA_ORIENTATION=+
METNRNRREFLKYAGVATAVASTSASSLLIPTISRAEEMSTVTKAAAASSSTAISLPSMGLGAWAWGDSLFWGYNPKQDDDLKQVFDYALDKNLAFFDTAELYGLGRSEMLLGKFREESGEENGSKVQIATKFAALPWCTKSSDVVKACRKSLKRLNPSSPGSPIKPIDLYQIHFPNAWSNEAYWDGLAQCYEEGLVKSVGVSNYGVDALRAVHAKLAERNIPLASNQIQLSLLYQYPLQNGLIDTCKELDVKVLSYSPLALGFLTGKYNVNNRPDGPRKAIAETLFDGTEEGQGAAFSNLLSVMQDISFKHDNAPLSQIALNWTRSKGTIPIPGARNLRQVTQNLGALDWNLSDEEVLALDTASSTVPPYISVDKSPFPKVDINTKLKMFDS